MDTYKSNSTDIAPYSAYGDYAPWKQIAGTGMASNWQDQVVTEVVIESKGGKETEVRKSFRAYNEKGNLTEEIEYDDDGKIKNHTTSEYNEKQQKVKETAFLPDGKIESIALYTYDPEGNRISKTTMNKDGSVKSKKVFHYEYR